MPGGAKDETKCRVEQEAQAVQVPIIQRPKDNNSLSEQKAERSAKRDIEELSLAAVGKQFFVRFLLFRDVGAVGAYGCFPGSLGASTQDGGVSGFFED